MSWVVGDKADDNMATRAVIAEMNDYDVKGIVPEIPRISMYEEDLCDDMSMEIKLTQQIRSMTEDEFKGTVSGVKEPRITRSPLYEEDLCIGW